MELAVSCTTAEWKIEGTAVSETIIVSDRGVAVGQDAAAGQDIGAGQDMGRAVGKVSLDSMHWSKDHGVDVHAGKQCTETAYIQVTHGTQP